MKVLIVDDEQSNRMLLSFMLSDYGYDFIEAENGQVACDVLAEYEDIDLVLLDVNMPVMDGYEAATIIKRQYQKRFLPILFVTYLSDDNVLEKCLAVGGDDFIPKPVNENVMNAKLKAHQRTLEFYRSLESTNESLHYYQQMVQREHKIVEKIFQNGRNRMDVTCENIVFHMSPMSMFDGDLLLIAPSPVGGVFLLLGDFTGHGLAAAVGCLPVSDIFYAMTAKHANVGEIACEINQRLEGLLPDNMFFCAAVIELSPKGDSLSLWAGGMNDLLVVNEKGDLYERIESQHMPLGILSAEEFDKQTLMIHPEKGARIYMCTDGVIESKNSEGEMFGQERLEAVVTATEQENRVEAVFNAIREFRGGGSQDDDITIVELICTHVTHRGKEGPVCRINPRKEITLGCDKIPWVFNIKLMVEELKNAGMVKDLVQTLISICHAESNKNEIFMLLSELYSNSLEHGVLGLDSRKKSTKDGFAEYYQDRQTRLLELKDGFIEIEAKMEADKSTQKLLISLTNSGAGFDYESVYNQSALEESAELNLSYGRGIGLIQSLCESVQYSNEGRTVSVVYTLER